MIILISSCVNPFEICNYIIQYPKVFVCFYLLPLDRFRLMYEPLATKKVIYYANIIDSRQHQKYLDSLILQQTVIINHHGAIPYCESVGSLVFRLSKS
jgi:hypothetical protein